MSITDIFFKGGIVMWLILLCALIVVVAAIRKFIIIQKAKINLPSFMIKIRGMIKKGDIKGAIQYCQQEKSPASVVVRKGLKKIRFGTERIKDVMESAGRQEIYRLEKGLSLLAAMAGIAPLLGFAGTVYGMIYIFIVVEKNKSIISFSDISGGLWSALLATIAGLVVGILSLALYNYFIAKIRVVVSDMEIMSGDIIDIVEETNWEEIKEFDEVNEEQV